MNPRIRRLKNIFVYRSTIVVCGMQSQDHGTVEVAVGGGTIFILVFFKKNTKIFIKYELIDNSNVTKCVKFETPVVIFFKTKKIMTAIFLKV